VRLFWIEGEGSLAVPTGAFLRALGQLGSTRKSGVTSLAGGAAAVSGAGAVTSESFHVQAEVEREPLSFTRY